MMTIAALTGAAGLVAVAPASSGTSTPRTATATRDVGPLAHSQPACRLASDIRPLRRQRDELASHLFAPARHAVYFARGRAGSCGSGRQQA